MEKNFNPAAEARPGVVLWKTFAASAAVMVIGLAGLLQATAMGNAFTTETLRRAEIAARPAQVPDLRVRDADGRTTTLHRVLAEGQDVWIVDFVYTRCQTVCTTLGAVFQQLQQQVQDRKLEGRVGLLSISFDPAGDTAAVMRDYRLRMRMDPAIWQLLTLESPKDRPALLAAFGLMVIPAPPADFEHNAALLVITGDGWLVHIADTADAARVIDAALTVRP